MALLTLAQNLPRPRLHEARRGFSALFAALFLCLIPAAASAQTENPPPSTSKVHSVKFTGSNRFPQDLLARTIGMAPGTVVGRTEIAAAANRLAKMGWFSEVNYKFDSSTKGVEITFLLRDAPAHPVLFDNFPWFKDAEIADAIRSTGMPYDGMAPESGTGLDSMREAIAALLKSKNIPGEVDGELIQAPQEDGMVERFKLIGANIKVTSLSYSDALAQNDLRLKEVEDQIVGKPYSRYTLAIFEVEQVQPAYTSKGYLHVRCGEPIVKFVGQPGKPLSGEISLQVSVEPGTQYHWGGAVWSGQTVLNSAALDGLLGFAAGDPVDALKLQAGWDAITHEYAKRGYLEAKLDPKPTLNDADGKATYTVTIAEGIQYRMGQLVIAGLSLTAERQLLANWKLARGDVFDDSYFEDFANGGALKLFKNTPVHFDRVEHLLKPNPDTKTVDVYLNFR